MRGEANGERVRGWRAYLVMKDDGADHTSAEVAVLV